MTVRLPGAEPPRALHSPHACMSHGNATEISPIKLTRLAAVPAAAEVSRGRVTSLARSSGVAIVGGVLSQALKALVIMYVARQFGATGFGSFSFAFSINAFLYIIAQFGLPTLGAREIAQQGALPRSLAGAITRARMVLALCSMAVVIAIVSASQSISREELWLVIGFALSNVALAGFSDWIFQGLHRLHGWAVLNVCWQGFWLVLVLAIAHWHGSIALVAFAYAAAALLASAIGWLWLGRTAASQSEYVTGYSVGSVLRSGAHLGTGTILSTSLVWSDTIIVRLMAGAHGAGLYAAGNRAALALGMLAGFYMQGAFPVLARASAEGRDKYARHFQQAYNNMAVLFVPVAVWSVIYAPELIRLVFKQPEYLAAVRVFQLFQGVFLLTMIAVVLYGLGGLLACREDGSYRRRLFAATIVLLVSCPALAYRWGIEGAAVAALLSLSVLLVLFEQKVRAFVTPKHGRALLLPALCGLAAGVLSKEAHLAVIPSGLLLLLGYAALGIYVKLSRPVLAGHAGGA